MLSNTLNTNEVKNAAGTEVEFTRLSIGDRETVYAQVNENPALPNRLAIKHSESGSGVNKRRRSVVRFDKSSTSAVDLATTVVTSAYLVVDLPVGHLTTSAEPAAVLAYIMSFVASLGASTTILYDGTGNGAACLIGGGI